MVALDAGRSIPGTVWIAREPGADSTAWEMLDGTGERVGRIVLPDHQEVIASKESLIVTLELDELDVPFLTTYRIQR